MMRCAEISGEVGVITVWTETTTPAHPGTLVLLLLFVSIVFILEASSVRTYGVNQVYRFVDGKDLFHFLYTQHVLS